MSLFKFGADCRVKLEAKLSVFVNTPPDYIFAFHAIARMLRTLYKSVAMYNPDRQRFAAYGSCLMKNSVNPFIRDSVRKSSSEGPGALTYRKTTYKVYIE
jgi:hypothetical protein